MSRAIDTTGPLTADDVEYLAQRGQYGFVVTANSEGEPDTGELKGEDLDKALTDVGLVKTGTADEKRDRLTAHLKADTA